MVEDGHGCGLGAVTRTHEVEEDLIGVMDTEGNATTKGVIFG